MPQNRTAFRVTEILQLLASSPEGMTISEISTALNLPKTSAFDIVHTLRETSFLREANKRFAIGFMAGEVGKAYDQGKDLVGSAKEALTALADKSRLAISLVLLETDGLNYIFQYRPAGVIVAPSSSAGEDFLHASASGKVLLAFAKESRAKRILDGLKYPGLTSQTITTRKEFDEELNRVRAQGYGVDNREYNDLLTCVSVPLVVHKQVVAAITLSGLQMNEEDMLSAAIELNKAATEIAQQLMGDE